MEKKFAEKAKEKDKKDGSDSDLDSEDGKKGKKPVGPTKLSDSFPPARPSLSSAHPLPARPSYPLWLERHVSKPAPSQFQHFQHETALCGEMYG
jgi:hypothetical protein